MPSSRASNKASQSSRSSFAGWGALRTHEARNNFKDAVRRYVRVKRLLG